MAASNLDKFLKGARKLSGVIDSSGIINGTVDNFGLSSGSGLPTDTGVEIIIDRVDSNGAKTPAKEEGIRGVMDGDRVVSAVRGVSGTAQAHGAGAVWEVMLTADQWNRMIDGILAEHNQDGSHKWGGWSPYSAVIPTRASADDPTYVLTFAGVDLTSKLSEGCPVKFTQNGATVFGWVSKNPTFSTNTTVTLYCGTDYDVLDTATYPITNFFFGQPKTAPFGFPINPTKWTVQFTNADLITVNSPTQNIWVNGYGVGQVILTVPIGAWNLEKMLNMEALSAAANANIQNTLSTTTAAESDVEMTDSCYATSTLIWAPSYRRKFVTLAAKTNYYLNIRTIQASHTAIYIRGDAGKTIVRAVSAYL